MSADAVAGLGFDSPNRYFLRVAEGADARDAANAIESEFSASGMETTLLKEQLAEARNSIQSVFYLVQGFVGLGLLQPIRVPAVAPTGGRGRADLNRPRLGPFMVCLRSGVALGCRMEFEVEFARVTRLWSCPAR